MTDRGTGVEVVLKLHGAFNPRAREALLANPAEPVRLVIRGCSADAGGTR